ncbi:MAG: cytochrome c3 family protein [Blastocatellia bacterium]
MRLRDDVKAELDFSRRRFKRYVMLVFALLFAAIFTSSMFGGKGEAQSRKSQSAPAKKSQSVPAAGVADSSRFNHTSSKHGEMKCDQCHQRRADAIKPVMPGHRACIACHIKEFTSTGFGICANCHDGIKAVQPAVLQFPERQSFGTEFSHKTHATYQSGERRAECSDCHQIAGARATFPAHRECYVCHKAPEQVKAGERVGGASCGECHTTTGDKTPPSVMSGAYKFRFTHQVHAQREGIKCSECHSVLTGGTEAQVSLPALSQHRGAGYKNCGGCHNGRRAFSGELVDKACARCHGRPMI